MISLLRVTADIFSKQSITMLFLLILLEGILNLLMFEKKTQRVLALMKFKIRKNAPTCGKTNDFCFPSDCF